MKADQPIDAFFTYCILHETENRLEEVVGEPIERQVCSNTLKEAMELMGIKSE